MAEAGLLAGLELVVRLVLVLVRVLQEVRSQGRREWMRKIGVDHNNCRVVGVVTRHSPLAREFHGDVAGVPLSACPSQSHMSGLLTQTLSFKRAQTS